VRNLLCSAFEYIYKKKLQTLMTIVDVFHENSVSFRWRFVQMLMMTTDIIVNKKITERCTRARALSHTHTHIYTRACTHVRTETELGKLVGKSTNGTGWEKRRLNRQTETVTTSARTINTTNNRVLC
jgi:hypothetical protein